jgi:hypothetical protein
VRERTAEQRVDLLTQIAAEVAFAAPHFDATNF